MRTTTSVSFLVSFRLRDTDQLPWRNGSTCVRFVHAPWRVGASRSPASPRHGASGVHNRIRVRIWHTQSPWFISVMRAQHPSAAQSRPTSPPPWPQRVRQAMRNRSFRERWCDKPPPCASQTMGSSVDVLSVPPGLLLRYLLQHVLHAGAAGTFARPAQWITRRSGRLGARGRGSNRPNSSNPAR